MVNNTITNDISELKTGTYFVQINTQGITETLIFVKQ
jgi:hypothetical protein